MINAFTKIKVLFVCMGNICRSPLAEGVFASYLKQQNLENNFIIDSAGTSNYHVGDLPDRRARQVAVQDGFNLVHRARQIVPQDLDLFDYILVMDHLNYDAVLGMAKTKLQQDKIFLFRSFDNTNPDHYEVPDPYYGGFSDFIEVGEITKLASIGFISFLKQENILVAKSITKACLV
jgi:protein-tyrosine phosphatase